MSAEGVENVKKKQEKLSVCVCVGGPALRCSQWRIIQGYWNLLAGVRPVPAHCLLPNWSQQFSFTAVFVYCESVCVCLYERGGGHLTGEDDYSMCACLPV